MHRWGLPVRGRAGLHRRVRVLRRELRQRDDGPNELRDVRSAVRRGPVVHRRYVYEHGLRPELW